MTADVYTIASGDSVYAGWPRPSVLNTVVFGGDSLTDPGYGELHTGYGLNARAGGVLKPIANIGVAGHTVRNLLDRINNPWNAASPGLAGLGRIGFFECRIGTNNARGGVSISAGMKTDYQQLIAEVLTKYADHFIMHAVPPLSAPDNGAGVNSFNAWLASYCPTVPGCTFIDDTTGVNDGTGAWVATYKPADGVHGGTKAAARMTADGSAPYNALILPLGLPSPVSRVAGDIYPANPQWVRNPHNTGTGGTNSIGSGSMPTYWNLGQYGSGYGASTLILAADAGDSNTDPWLRVNPTSVGSSGYMQLVTYLNGRAITASDPAALDLVIEIRFNNFDATRFSMLRAFVYGYQNEKLTADTTKLQMGDAVMNGVQVLRTAIPRAGTKISHTGAQLNIELPSGAAFSGAMGSFDIRCATVRG
ncbi:SGNH/GDSL hydrolase family protein [Variovorax sp. HJSM1_2]|uniref:SGNH/GDSL hydrolase family protein n=1 Tax=Variovorax sp. HJSM1_2 TaxID=3366263 RepID=UPI003BBC0B70